MAVPSSGTLSLIGIWNEVSEDDYSANAHSAGEDASLSDLSDGSFDTLNTDSAAIPNQREQAKEACFPS